MKTIHARATVIEGGWVGLSFAYDPLTIEYIKANWPGANWDGNRKMWLIPIELHTELTKSGELKTGTIERVRAGGGGRVAGAHHYQQEDINVLYSALLDTSGAINATEMGLGKTFEAISVAKLLRSKRIVVVCQPIAKGVWQDEIKRWGDLDTGYFIARGLIPEARPVYATNQVFLIVNYDILAPRKVVRRTSPQERLANKGKGKRFTTTDYSGWVDAIIDWKPDLLIVDEFSLLYGKKAKRREAVKRISDHTKYRLFMDGTPPLDRPHDLWPALDALFPGPTITINDQATGEPKRVQLGGRFGKEHVYGVRYSGAFHNGYGWDYDSGTEQLAQALARNATKSADLLKASMHWDELKARLNAVMVQRTSDQIGREVPPVLIQTVPVSAESSKKELAQDRQFGDLVKRLGLNVLDSPEGIRLLGQIQQAISLSKVQSTVDLSMDSLRASPHLLVFAHYIETQQRIVKRLIEEGIPVFGFTGMETEAHRQAQIAQWRAAPSAALVITTGAGGRGLNLSEARIAIFNDLEWSPRPLWQAIKRIHRPAQGEAGSSHKIAKFLVAKGRVVEEFLLEAVINKTIANLSFLDRPNLLRGLEGASKDNEDQESQIDFIKSLLAGTGEKEKEGLVTRVVKAYDADEVEGQDEDPQR